MKYSPLAISLFIATLETSSCLPTPKADQSGSTSISVGNVFNSNHVSQTGNSGFFTGDSGSIATAGNGINNRFNQNTATIGSVEVGNVKDSKSRASTGQGSGWGDSGSIGKVGNSIGNTLSGSAGASIGNFNVGNSISSTAGSNTGKAGWLGGQSGQVASSGNAMDNKVTITGSNVEGSVGTVQGSGSTAQSGRGRGWGDSGSIQQSGNGMGNVLDN